MSFNRKRHVFIIGSKGIPSKYGGFESFVEHLTHYRKHKNIIYHVSCLSKFRDYKYTDREFVYNKAYCFNIRVPNIGAAKAVFYDIAALKHCITYIKNKNISNSIIYILACRIGPFIKHYKKQFSKLGIKLYINPDGQEWKRGKWSLPIKKYWKLSEKLMVKQADLLICDSKNIERYILNNYREFNPNTMFIAYGAETKNSTLKDDDKKVLEWYFTKGIQPKSYYLVVGRFVPENNYEIMLREFMRSETKRDLVLITNVRHNKFYEKLIKTTHFDKDPRIKFVGTIYDQQLLKKVRETAYAYIHGHEVGGTNPSLLEALGSTNLNLLLNVGFNQEVGRNCALYWEKTDGSLASLIDRVDKMNQNEINEMGEQAKKRINTWYSWNYIVDRYEKTFLDAGN